MVILGSQLRDAIRSGANHLTRYKTEVNDLNIFPVPDGDTGTNMSMTMDAGAQALASFGPEFGAGAVAAAVTSAMLRGARGNSGVILSLLFRGFSKGLADQQTMSGKQMVESLEIGVGEAYQAVMNPTEGTMLTVARVAAERGREALNMDDNPITVWEAVCQGAYDALETTPELLPVLKRAGVVDAGGKGLCLIFEGMMSVFKNGIILEAGVSGEEAAAFRVHQEAEIDAFFRNAAAEFDQEIHFTYCTECIVGWTSGEAREVIPLRRYLEGIGDSVVVAADAQIIKIHVHTETPGLALHEAQQYGELLMVKVDNMKEQHRKAAEENEARKEGQEAQRQEAQPQETKPVRPAPQEPVEDIGFVSVAAGEGLKQLFLDLGCSVVVSGGQTMNPSTQDLMAAVLATPARTVYILPNNKNILLAAEQTVPLVKDREVVVIPTRTIPQGLSAMLEYDPAREDNREEMMQAAAGVQSGLVTFAARDSEFDGHSIRKGQILGMENGKLTHVEKDPVTACMKVVRALMNKNTDFITLIYGNGMTKEEAEAAKALIAAKTRFSAEINLVEGNQPLYYFIISVE